MIRMDHQNTEVRMSRYVVLCLIALSAGCFRSSRVAGPGGVSNSTDVTLPGFSYSDTSAAIVPPYDACLAKKGSFPNKEKLCMAETLMASPVSAVWWCGGWASYGVPMPVCSSRFMGP